MTRPDTTATHDGEFVRRHLGPDEPAVADMLAELGASSLDEMTTLAVPPAIVTQRPLDVGPPLSERETLVRLREIASQNRVMVSMIGMGYYDTELPEVIRRNVLEDPGWYTAYTPYQAEISQGRLEVLLTFQQMVMDLTGMEIATASLLDEATAAAEAMAMARRVSKSKSNRFVVSADCHPQTLGVVATRARTLGLEVAVTDGTEEPGDCFGVLVQYPGSSGRIDDLGPVVEAAHAQGALVTVASDLLALMLLTAPGEAGADIVVGSAQRFGVPMGYGGPHAAFFATRDAYKRSAPGRIIGVSRDSHGRPALRMALQTREQHIRREKATSNICTAQVLLAVIAALYAVYHGPGGLRAIAERVHRRARALASGLERLDHRVVHPAYFDTLTVEAPGAAEAVAERAREAGINLRVIDADRIGISVDEMTEPAHLAAVWSAFSPDAEEVPDPAGLEREAPEAIPPAHRRTDEILVQPVFNRYHSETEMLRYMRRLAGKDLALDRGMIPLGSCTMKLNATTEMVPVTMPGFSGLHPFAPRDQAAGYTELFAELEAMLCECTGFDAVSLQPNAGSQGEYAGLLTIRRYHESRGESGRDVCLIPASAHGTNPASARMAGLEVVVVDCDENGNVDLDDLRAKAEANPGRVGSLMVTYPSTHGVFEAGIKEICAIVHEHGGQVYLDGANLNALLGIARLAEIGADVAHINLHKTFCIPHGGGGPGMGPIGVREHLAPFLPDHPVVPGVNPAAENGGIIGPVSAAPWGSASILPISWAYIAMMGGDGLRRATQVAILNANYIARRLEDHYPVLYTGQNGMVAHECIIDLRGIKATSGVTVDDVAKRLVDYGFHAPTMSFPVADTLMIEPTESESKFELDRFCDAMISIRAEIEKVESGAWDPEDNPLHNAPHTQRHLFGDGWSRPYRAAEAYFPLPYLEEEKYWPPVGRVDNAYGDRHLVCGWPDGEDD